MARTSPLPKNLMAGISTRYDNTPPAAMIEEIRGPMMYPTPSSAGLFSMETEPASNGLPKTFVGYSFQVFQIS